MEDFGFYKTIRLEGNKKIDGAFSKLHNVYKDIPETKGCLDNIQCHEGCKGWCCEIQTPQLLYSEFLLIWRQISKEWDDDKICDLFERCMLNAVNDIPSKGCVFFDTDTKLCKVHKNRPYNCRIYGITPDKEFSHRYEKLKEEYSTIPGAVLREQCESVSTADGKEVTSNDTMDWWIRAVSADRFIGIPADMITDKMGGSYRTPHDHVLLYNIPENVLNGLAGIKRYPDVHERMIAVKEIINCIKHFYIDAVGEKNEKGS